MSACPSVKNHFNQYAQISTACHVNLLVYHVYQVDYMIYIFRCTVSIFHS